MTMLFGGAVFGLGELADYKNNIHPVAAPWLKERVGFNLPTDIPYWLVVAVFLVSGLIALVHREAMRILTTPRLLFSKPTFALTTLGPEAAEDAPRTPAAIGYVEVFNKPFGRVGGLPVGSAWATASFRNLTTGSTVEVRYCRWTDNPKPRRDYHNTTTPVRFQPAWRCRDLPANGEPHRLDFFVHPFGGERTEEPYGFAAQAQERHNWKDPDHVLWVDTPILVTLTVDGESLDQTPTTTFVARFGAGLPEYQMVSEYYRAKRAAVRRELLQRAAALGRSVAAGVRALGQRAIRKY